MKYDVLTVEKNRVKLVLKSLIVVVCKQIKKNIFVIRKLSKMNKMKKSIILCVIAIFPLLVSCQNSNKSNMKKKTLVAYFSCTGNTRQLAQNLAEVVNGDLYEIKPEVPYTSADLDWNDKNSRSTKEMQDKSSRPSITGKVNNFKDYEVIFVGFPIWWGIAPTIVNTFLESYDFSGKTVIPFCTSGSSGVGQTEKYLHSSCSKETEWCPAKRLSSSADKSSIKKWVDGLQY